MSKPFEQVKYTELKRLMRHLNAVQALSYADCWELYGQNKNDMVARLYNKIAEVAKK